MNNVADKTNMGVTRRITWHPNGTFTVHVKPPAWVGDYPELSVEIDTPEKVLGYKQWFEGDYIQRALRMLSEDEREILLNGAVFTFPEEEEEED